MTVEGRIVCADYGSVRIGIAVSDPTATFAQPREHIRNTGLKQTAAEIAGICSKNSSDTLVIGLPLKFNGSEGPEAENVRKLKEIVETDFGIKTVLWDERLTSVSAERALLESDMSRKKRKEKIDSVAAAIILQSYLDFLNASKSV